MEGQIVLLTLIFIAGLPFGQSINYNGNWGKCFEGEIYPVDQQKQWNGYSCYDKQGNEYKADQTVLSCCGCIKLTCNNSQSSLDYYGGRKSFWNVSEEDTCCKDCHGKVYPIGAVISSQSLKDSCSTTVTKQCVARRQGTNSVASISESFEFKSCCADFTGLYPLGKITLDQKTCSTRNCSLQQGNLYASWNSSIKECPGSGCDCCVYDGKLICDGGHVTLPDGVNATCCKGDVLRPPTSTPDTTTTTTTATTTTTTTTTATTTTCSRGPFVNKTCFGAGEHLNFYDLGKNWLKQIQKPEWIISDGGRTVNQKLNTRPSVGVTNLGQCNASVRFSGRVYSTQPDDDDVIGMVFGYQNEANFFVVASAFDPPGPSPLMGTTNWYVGRLHATCGQSCANQTTISDAIWDPLNHPQEITVLANGTQHWEHDIFYEFSICFNPSKLHISVNVTVEGGDQVLHSGNISAETNKTDVDDMSRNGGRIGVYVDSQEKTTWDKLKCQNCTLI